MKRFLILFAVVANLVFVDALVKELAEKRLEKPVEVVRGLFDLAYVQNRGCAWGMLQGQVWPLAVFGLLALAFLIWKRKTIFVSQPSQPLNFSTVAEPLLYAGIVGNLIDRLYRGYVIDMFDFHWGVHHFPCFNVADSLICIAVGLMLVSSFFTGPEKGEKKPSPDRLQSRPPTPLS